MSVVTLIDFREKPEISITEIYDSMLSFFPRKKAVKENFVKAAHENVDQIKQAVDYFGRKLNVVYLNDVLRLGMNYLQPWMMAIDEPLSRVQVVFSKEGVKQVIDLLSGHTIGNRSVISEFSVSADDLIKIAIHEYGHQNGLYDHDDREHEYCFMSIFSTKHQNEFCDFCLEKLLK